MGRAFRCAGTSQVLTSLWSVDEAATVLFTEPLFTHLRDGSDALAPSARRRPLPGGLCPSVLLGADYSGG